MNSVNQQMENLLNSAALAAQDLREAPPFALESRVLARWRRLPAGAGDVAQVLLPVLRQAALCACLLMLLSIAFNYRTIVSVDTEEAAIANSAVDLSVLP
jgi:hypothetical protein